MRRGDITKEEYILVRDADLKYEAGLHMTSIQLDVGSHPPSPREHASRVPCLSPCPPSAASRAASLNPPLDSTVDPITHEVLGNNTFTFVTPQGNSINYNIVSLVEYITSSGDFRDPVTRLPLTPEHVKEIDDRIAGEISSQHHLSSLQSVRENANFYCVEKQKKEECQNFETFLGEMIVDMLELVQTPTSGLKAADVAEMRMFMLFSEFESPFQRLKELDIEQARHSLLSWRVLLSGPAKKPTKERGPAGIMKTALVFLDGQWTAADNTKLKAYRASFEK